MDALVSTLASLLLARQLVVVEPADTAVHGTAALVTLDRRELGTKKYHAAVALSGFGDVVGAVLDRQGRTVCALAGEFDRRCLTLVGCGVARTVCP